MPPGAPYARLRQNLGADHSGRTNVPLVVTNADVLHDGIAVMVDRVRDNAFALISDTAIDLSNPGYGGSSATVEVVGSMG